MKPFIKAFNAGITLGSMRRNDIVTSKNGSFFQFWGHNVPINCSKLSGVRKKKLSPCAQLYLEVSYMFVCAKLTKLQSKENFDTNPDPDPECILICHVRSNTK